MASLKRELSIGDEPASKKSKIHGDGGASDSAKPNSEKQRVVLNPADCNLDFDIEENGCKGSALHEQGFAYCWSGARANIGITGGKYCFSCKIISAQVVDMEDTALDQQHVCRIGISRGDDAVGNLGETEHSFGFGGTGKVSNAGRFSDYGEKFGVGDTIICAVDLESKPLASVGFSKNGKWLGTAMQFDSGPKGLGLDVDPQLKEQCLELAVFPHILLKNVVVMVQFSVEEGLLPEAGYKPWASAVDDGHGIMGPVFSDVKDCEVMMLVGLPASGKTTWAEKWVKDHPEKRYMLLGTNLILDQMKVPGLLRKKNYGERFDRLMSRANAMFDTLLARSSRTPRNYIIDQTNVYKSARKRKLRPFANFHKIAIVLFPTPEELKYRAEKRFKEMGKEVPAEAVNNMLANFVLPMTKGMNGSDEFFDKVIFVELDRGESQRYLNEMKRALVRAPNPNDFSPYSRESSIDSGESSTDSGARPLPQYEGALSVSSGHWQRSHIPPAPLNHYYQTPDQVNSTYCRKESYSPVYRGYQNPPVPRAPAPYETYRSSAPRGNAGYSESYRPIPGSGTNTYQRHGDVGLSIRPNIYGRNVVGGADPYRSSMAEYVPFGSARPASSEYSVHSIPISVTGAPPTGIQASRAATFSPGPLSTPYGRPYGISNQNARPLYENGPAYRHPAGGYPLPHQSYF
ncbi:heterogeneous nuclear ribonucleoprotein U-like protein 1 isoform X2 [Tripterygium wilfordii]|uniref:heterogeneous nuclear ribonucleoprotein U-like protein 1 isoform X2 n=1 Tax=Tripterygium wilfordii TaxID=458696 RepID=UPI0018F800F9|nr:heterogeneous nuclear ribonucleoprotein U-like protein 1 isoform X2 [Tripterygium wilfordii]